jgi:hypothetical protein
MNWKLKAHSLALLSRLPAGRGTYHWMQRVLGTTNLQVDESIRRSLEVITLAREAGANLADGTWLEVGTGWRPLLPFVLFLIGVKRIITLDVNPWLTERYAFETFAALEGQLERLAAETGQPAVEVRSRYQRIRQCGSRPAGLLQACHIEYRCPADAGATGLPDKSADVVCSSNVLEHITPFELSRIHRESFRILREDGLAVHRLNPADHFSHVDSSITGANFLRYSEAQWRWYGGTGLAYHNRLRCPQHERLLTEAGFGIEISRVRTDERTVVAIVSGALPVHRDFSGFSAEELAADYMWLVGWKAPSTCPIRPTRNQSRSLSHA